MVWRGTEFGLRTVVSTVVPGGLEDFGSLPGRTLPAAEAVVWPPFVPTAVVEGRPVGRPLWAGRVVELLW